MALRTANRLVHSAEVWLKRRRRARHDRRRCQSYNNAIIPPWYEKGGLRETHSEN